jgi:glycosidase
MELIYNMNPRNYDSIDDMIGYIDNIKEMGFTTIWINPFQKPTDKKTNFTNQITGEKIEDGQRYIFYDINQ